MFYNTWKKFKDDTSKVNDVSAIFVDIMTFLFPLGVGANTRSLKKSRNNTNIDDAFIMKVLVSRLV